METLVYVERGRPPNSLVSSTTTQITSTHVYILLQNRHHPDQTLTSCPQYRQNVFKGMTAAQVVECARAFVKEVKGGEYLKWVKMAVRKIDQGVYPSEYTALVQLLSLVLWADYDGKLDKLREAGDKLVAHLRK